MNPLLSEAIKTRLQAHAPYSKFMVGAAIRDDQGQIYGGCNVENASYGATICAERTAVVRMVGQSGARKITEVVVVTDGASGHTPCGICRQVLTEFSADPKKTLVHIANTQKILKTFTLEDLLPESFKL
ncbi:MAG: cytidine deaminase [Bdellovibrionota bacterium]